MSKEETKPEIKSIVKEAIIKIKEYYSYIKSYIYIIITSKIVIYIIYY